MPVKIKEFILDKDYCRDCKSCRKINIKNDEWFFCFKFNMKVDYYQEACKEYAEKD